MIHVLINGNNFNTAILDEALEEIPKNDLYLIYVSKSRFGAARVLELYAKKNGIPYETFESIEDVDTIDVIITVLKGHPSPDMKKIMAYKNEFTKHVTIDKRIKKISVVDYDELSFDDASCDDTDGYEGYDSHVDELEDPKYNSCDSDHDEYKNPDSELGLGSGSEAEE